MAKRSESKGWLSYEPFGKPARTHGFGDGSCKNGYSDGLSKVPNPAGLKRRENRAGCVHVKPDRCKKSAVLTSKHDQKPDVLANPRPKHIMDWLENF